MNMRQLFGELGIEEQQQSAVYYLHVRHGTGNPYDPYRHLLRQHPARYS
jgi:hypothetical protein